MKYLITQTQLEDVQVIWKWLCFGEVPTDRQVPASGEVQRMLDSLKPIEPLNDPVIATIYFGATQQSLRPQDNKLAHSFARAIERHILGEKND